MRRSKALLTYTLLLSLWDVNYCNAQLHQDDYHIVIDRIVVDNFNKDLLQEFQVVAYKYNDTLAMKAVNISVILFVGVKEKISLTAKILKYVADDYRAIPFDITLDLCEEVKHAGLMNPFGVKTALEMSNFRGCPLLAKKNYHLWNWAPEEDKSPPHLPPGQYCLKVYVEFDDNIFGAEVSAFVQLVPQKGGKKKRRRQG